MSGPNILYIHSHDTGRYIQPLGRAVPTPNLQRLAEGGVLFRQAFCAAPVCSASRSALLTGQAPHSAGMIGLAHRGFRLNDYRQHLVQFLGAAGYHTALAGAQHEAPAPGTLIGYQEILPVRGGQSADIAATAAAFLGNSPALRAPGGELTQPFFLSVGFNDTHRVFHARDPRDEGQREREVTEVVRTERELVAVGGETASAGQARVVDQEVELAETTDRGRHHRLDLLGVADVRHGRHASPTERLDVDPGPLQVLGVPGGDESRNPDAT